MKNKITSIHIASNGGEPKGMVLLATLFMLMVLVLIAAAISSSTMTEMTVSGSNRDTRSAFISADMASRMGTLISKVSLYPELGSVNQLAFCDTIKNTQDSATDDKFGMIISPAYDPDGLLLTKDYSVFNPNQRFASVADYKKAHVVFYRKCSPGQAFSAIKEADVVATIYIDSDPVSPVNSSYGTIVSGGGAGVGGKVRSFSLSISGQNFQERSAGKNFLDDDAAELNSLPASIVSSIVEASFDE